MNSVVLKSLMLGVLLCCAQAGAQAILIESGGAPLEQQKQVKPQKQSFELKSDMVVDKSYDSETIANRGSIDYLTRYKPNYFISGDPDTKIQFSFKYQLLRNYGLFFGYRQLIFWELFERSRPIVEVNYNPEFFWRLPLEDSVVQYFQIGFWGHDSNGLEGPVSRSYDKHYLQLNTRTALASTDFEWSGQLYTFSNFDPDSEEIREYLGYGEMTFGFVNFFGDFLEQSHFYLRLYTGASFGKGGRELGAKFRVFWGEFTPLFFVQYFDGYGESQLRMTEYERALRAGIAF
ncbi:MAG: phospholipase A [Pseudobdellovibrionaceae bacterium]